MLIYWRNAPLSPNLTSFVHDTPGRSSSKAASSGGRRGHLARADHAQRGASVLRRKRGRFTPHGGLWNHARVPELPPPPLSLNSFQSSTVQSSSPTLPWPTLLSVIAVQYCTDEFKFGVVIYTFGFVGFSVFRACRNISS